MWFLNRIIFKLGNESENLWIMLDCKKNEKREYGVKFCILDWGTLYLAQS